MDTFVASALPVLAIGILISVSRRITSQLVLTSLFYVAFAVIFGCIHFLLYRDNPNFYNVKDIDVPASAEAVIRVQNSLQSGLTQVSLLDALILKIVEGSQRTSQPLEFTLDHPHSYPLRYPGVDLNTFIRTVMVGPQKDQPVYTAIAHILFVADYRGIAKGADAYYAVGSPTKPNLVISEAAFDRAVLDNRSDYVKAIKGLFQPDKTSPRLFVLTDFFYFSFSITGIGEVTPRVHLIRMLVLVQILFTFLIPVAIDQSRKKRSASPTITAATTQPTTTQPPEMHAGSRNIQNDTQ